MYRNVNKVENLVSTDGNVGEDFVLINKEELAQLKRERDEYRAICHDFAESVLYITFNIFITYYKYVMTLQNQFHDSTKYKTILKQ